MARYQGHGRHYSLPKAAGQVEALVHHLGHQIEALVGTVLLPGLQQAGLQVGLVPRCLPAVKVAGGLPREVGGPKADPNPGEVDLVAGVDPALIDVLQKLVAPAGVHDDQAEV